MDKSDCHAISKALRLYGELVLKRVSLQRVAPRMGRGYWVNDGGRWMENDPVPVTAYGILSLETLLQDVQPE